MTVEDVSSHTGGSAEWNSGQVPHVKEIVRRSSVSYRPSNNQHQSPHWIIDVANLAPRGRSFARAYGLLIPANGGFGWPQRDEERGDAVKAPCL